MDFVQPSVTSIAVNRIFDVNGTQILGHLDANGLVYLINPNGIVFGRGAQVDVGGLVASTLDLNDPTLGGDTKTFSGSGSGSIVNDGTLTAGSGGYVALLANKVSNQGTISAQLGSVAVGAGSAATLTFAGSRLVHMQVDQGVLNALAENSGVDVYKRQPLTTTCPAWPPIRAMLPPWFSTVLASMRPVLFTTLASKASCAPAVKMCIRDRAKVGCVNE